MTKYYDCALRVLVTFQIDADEGEEEAATKIAVERMKNEIEKIHFMEMTRTRTVVVDQDSVTLQVEKLTERPSRIVELDIEVGEENV